MQHPAETPTAAEPIAPPPGPFQQLLGDGLALLPAPVRRLHSLSHDVVTTGRAEIVTARNPIARLLCRLAGLPRPGLNVPVTVGFHPDGKGGE